MSMHTSAQVERYLAEVDSALVARGVTDRDEILAGLREHIGADGRDTAEVLRELG
ncbi:HAAS signaling domain-containing protein [Aeromicrobium sp. UC242_57]|uniref:HAAS signaling domain-containing protein n=1 Tax=Aeromicrobium sp. UC242_57 TaxID=3374624 RepID=UPI0037B4A807